MWPESDEAIRPLKTGLTTGCCATACCVAAAYHLLAKKVMMQVSVTLPRGQEVQLTLTDNKQVSSQQVIAGVMKDAGDDPDVTHGARVFVKLTLSEFPEITFQAAQGVGTVTRTGLALSIGEPAINPVPRKMMTEHLQQIAQAYDYKGGFIVAVGVEGGEQLALKTMNGRLGIVGGLSILGVSGIVRPFSCSAYIASIFQGIDVATANGYQHIAASTGNRSEAAIKAFYQLPDIALIEMGDFVGAVIKHIKKVPVARLTLCGGLGKMSKLAQGQWNLHSQVASIDFDFIAQLAKTQGASSDLVEKILQANTSIEALAHCYQEKIDLATVICQQAIIHVRAKIPRTTQLDIWVIDRQGALIAGAGDMTK